MNREKKYMKTICRKYETITIAIQNWPRFYKTKVDAPRVRRFRKLSPCLGDNKRGI